MCNCIHLRDKRHKLMLTRPLLPGPMLPFSCSPLLRPSFTSWWWWRCLLDYHLLCQHLPTMTSLYNVNHREQLNASIRRGLQQTDRGVTLDLSNTGSPRGLASNSSFSGGSTEMAPQASPAKIPFQAFTWLPRGTSGAWSLYWEPGSQGENLFDKSDRRRLAS